MNAPQDPIVGAMRPDRDPGDGQGPLGTVVRLAVPMWKASTDVPCLEAQMTFLESRRRSVSARRAVRFTRRSIDPVRTCPSSDLIDTRSLG